MEQITFNQYKDALEIVKKYQLQVEAEYNELKKEITPNIYSLDTDIRDIEMSVRLKNGLMAYAHRNGIDTITIRDFYLIPNHKLKKNTRCIGDKSINEWSKIKSFVEINS